jgi:hypothetical protein
MGNISGDPSQISYSFREKKYQSQRICDIRKKRKVEKNELTDLVGDL